MSDTEAPDETDTEAPDEDAEAGPPPLPAGLADERFAANIRDERERQGKSQADIARLMRERGWSYHPQTVQRIEGPPEGQRRGSRSTRPDPPHDRRPPHLARPGSIGSRAPGHDDRAR